MKKGVVFNIQKFSIHDGPGIRTTVFLKGCPLNCRWCANPESKSTNIEFSFASATCLHCNSCVNACPKSCLHFNDNGLLELHSESCIKCGNCVAACPTHTLKTEGTPYTVDELMTEVLKDKDFYDKSGGGVTLSGGEPLLQKDFVYNFLKTLTKNEIHTTIETTAFVDSTFFASVLPYINLLYIDFKHPDDTSHLQMTDVSNRLIKENIRLASNAGKEIVIRIPVIPRFNHSKEFAMQYVDFLLDANIKNVHLLPFHQMGKGKWQAMNLDYLYENDKTMKKEEVSDMYEVMKNAGLNVQIGG